MRKKLPTIILIIILVAGLSLLLYPTISNWWNSTRQTYTIAEYIDNVSHLTQKEYDQILDSAREYNKSLLTNYDRYNPTPAQHAKYVNQLNLTGTGVMAYIEIQSIGVSLPIYHGVSDAVLDVGVGHIEGSSLPVGGKGTHCVLSGHRGLPSAKLFTDLDKIVVGDTFVITTLNEVLTYEVDQIRIVLPQEVSGLNIKKEEDYCTLVTCTPYGINSHRLLIRGHRISNAKEVAVTSDAVQVEPNIVAPIIAAPMLLAMLIAMFITTSKRKTKPAQTVEEIMDCISGNEAKKGNKNNKKDKSKNKKNKDKKKKKKEKSGDGLENE